MNRIFKQNLKELAETIDFPTLIYSYETKRIITANKKAKDMIGNQVRNVKDLFLNMQAEKYSEQLLDNGSEIFYQVSYTKGVRNFLVDQEVNSITLNDMHICIVFFEYSYKHIFESCLSIHVPRIYWKFDTKESIGKNILFKKEISKELFGLCFNENKELLYNTIKLVPSLRSREFFIRFSQISIIDRQGIVVGELGIYHRILGREEFVKTYEEAIKEIVLLERKSMSKGINEKDK